MNAFRIFSLDEVDDGVPSVHPEKKYYLSVEVIRQQMTTVFKFPYKRIKKMADYFGISVRELGNIIFLSEESDVEEALGWLMKKCGISPFGEDQHQEVLNFSADTLIFNHQQADFEQFPDELLFRVFAEIQHDDTQFDAFAALVVQRSQGQVVLERAELNADGFPGIRGPHIRCYLFHKSSTVPAKVVIGPYVPPIQFVRNLPQ